jgi:hypothetical protein
MDGIGLALDNFGPTGAWQTVANGQHIDPTGELPDGDVLHGPADVKAYLLKHRDDFVRALSERLLSYALGRTLTDRDRAALADAPTRIAKGGYRFSDVVLEVTQCEPFQAGWRGYDEQSRGAASHHEGNEL